MDELVFVGYGMMWLVTAMGLYIGAAALLNQYYMHAYNMRNFPKTYLIRYMILPKSDDDDFPAESSDSNADEETNDPESSDSNSSSEEESESEDQESESETLSGQNDYFNSGPEFLRVTFITCPPSDVVKKIKQSIKFDDEHEIFQLIGIEEL
jgi:hypothetical protein